MPVGLSERCSFTSLPTYGISNAEIWQGALNRNTDCPKYKLLINKDLCMPRRYHCSNIRTMPVYRVIEQLLAWLGVGSY